MDIREFNYTVHELWRHWKDVPLRWNSVQNDLMDNELDLFRIRTLPEFEQATAKMNEKLKTYWLRRWFIWRHSACDEFLFSTIPGVTLNPDYKSKQYDAMFSNGMIFDLKSTRIFNDWKCYAPELIQNTRPLIERFYKEQSSDRRYGMQNRLFIVHHSFVGNNREFLVRCGWSAKMNAFKKFSENINDVQFCKLSNGVKAGVIYVLEKEEKKIETIVCGL